MGPFTQHRRGLALAIAIATVIAAPAAVFAATGGGGTIYPRIDNRGVVVDIEGATFNNKLMATITFRVTCDPITYFDWDLYQEVTTTAGVLSGTGQLLQAQGRSIASASGFSPQTNVTCDGSTVYHASVQVLADNLPLRRGDAVAGIDAEVFAAGAGEEGNFGRSGPTAIKLR
jgi:hypothetical protein